MVTFGSGGVRLGGVRLGWCAARFGAALAAGPFSRRMRGRHRHDNRLFNIKRGEGVGDTMFSLT
jgi:hypothetical protein